jgi:hypothetical protein
MNLCDIFGVGGVGMILAAYFLSVNKMVSLESPTYNLLNLVGAILAFVSCWMLGSMPFVFLQAVWACVSIHSLWKYGFKSENK